jgi:hypothetical protein
MPESSDFRDLQIAVKALSERVDRLEIGVRSLAPGEGLEEDSQEVEAYVMSRRAEEHQIFGVMRRPLSEPVDPGDRHNVAKALWGLLQRTNELEDKLRLLASKLPSET